MCMMTSQREKKKPKTTLKFILEWDSQRNQEPYLISWGSVLGWWALTRACGRREPWAVLHDNLWSSRRTTAPQASRSSSFTPARLLQRLSDIQRAVSYCHEAAGSARGSPCGGRPQAASTSNKHGHIVAQSYMSVTEADRSAHYWRCFGDHL